MRLRQFLLRKLNNSLSFSRLRGQTTWLGHVARNDKVVAIKGLVKPYQTQRRTKASSHGYGMLMRSTKGRQQLFMDVDFSLPIFLYQLGFTLSTTDTSVRKPLAITYPFIARTWSWKTLNCSLRIDKILLISGVVLLVE